MCVCVCVLCTVCIILLLLLLYTCCGEYIICVYTVNIMWVTFLSTFHLIQGVFVMDRLSLAHIGSAQAITDGDVLSTVTTALTKENLGTLTHIDVLKVGRKRLAVVYTSSSKIIQKYHYSMT